jgi:hypothetical protein
LLRLADAAGESGMQQDQPLLIEQPSEARTKT